MASISAWDRNRDSLETFDSIASASPSAALFQLSMVGRSLLLRFDCSSISSARIDLGRVFQILIIPFEQLAINLVPSGVKESRLMSSSVSGSLGLLLESLT